MLHLSYRSEPVMKLKYQILLKSPPPVTVLAGSATGAPQTNRDTPKRSINETEPIFELDHSQVSFIL